MHVDVPGWSVGQRDDWNRYLRLNRLDGVGGPEVQSQGIRGEIDPNRARLFHRGPAVFRTWLMTDRGRRVDRRRDDRRDRGQDGDRLNVDA